MIGQTIEAQRHGKSGISFFAFGKYRNWDKSMVEQLIKSEDVTVIE